MTGISVYRWILPFGILCLLATLHPAVAGAFGDPDARWAMSSESSTRKLDHADWQAFLTRYTVSRGTPAQIYLNYGAVTPADRELLNHYLGYLQGIAVSDLARREQLAYWINLFNAGTVALLLDHYPLRDVREMERGWFTTNPAKVERFTVEGRRLSLDAIERSILLPLWRDPRLHYALNHGTVGDPNLMTEAFRADNTEALLEQAARDFINHPRGLQLRKSGWVVSSIYDWYEDDFGSTALERKGHWVLYASPGLTAALKGFREPDYDYDWRLNDAPRQVK